MFCFLSNIQKLQAHQLFCSLINSLMHAFFSFYFSCWLIYTLNWKASVVPCLFRAGCVHVTIHQGKSAWESCFTLKAVSLFSFNNIIVRNETATQVSLQSLLFTSTKVSSSPLPLAAANILPPSWPTQKLTWTAFGIPLLPFPAFVTAPFYNHSSEVHSDRPFALQSLSSNPSAFSEFQLDPSSAP